MESYNDKRTIAGNPKNSRLLIFEDSDVYTELIKRALIGEYYINTSDSVDNGVEICYDFKPDVIVLDINLAGKVSGLEFLQTIKKDINLSYIPVLIISAISSNDIISDGLQYGANDYLVKPFELKHLQFRIKNLLMLCEKIKQKYQNEMLIPLKTSPDNKQYIIEKLNKMTDEAIATKEELKITELAKELGVSQSKLGRIIRREYGVTTNNYLMFRKLEKAKLMLTTNKWLPIKEVASVLGFSSVAYFSKCFRKRFNCTPTEKQRKEGYATPQV